LLFLLFLCILGGLLIELLEVSVLLNFDIVEEVSIWLEVGFEHRLHLVAAVLQGVDAVVLTHENLRCEMTEAV